MNEGAGEFRFRFSKKELIFLLLLVSAMFALYHHTLKYDLSWDTKDFAKESILLHHDRPLFDAFRYGMIHGQMGDYKSSFYYRPIWNLSMMAEQRLWGFHNTGMRLVNTAIFSLALICLFIFLKFQNVSEDFPLLATALFAFLPIHADNVVWGVARCDLFLLLWGMLTAIFFHLWLFKKNKAYYFASVLFFALGIFSKETFLFFIPFLAAYEWACRRRLSWRRYLGYVLITGAFFFVKHLVLRLPSLGMQPLISIVELPRLFFSTLGYYARVLVFPIRLPKFAFASEIMNWKYLLLGGVSFLAAGVFLFRKRSEKAIIPVSLMVFFLLPHVLLAFSKLWPFKISARYMMIPAIGAVWLFCLGLGKGRRYLRYLAVAALIGVFLPCLLRSSFAYRNELTYWMEGYQAHPRNSIMLLFLAKAHYNADHKLLARHYLSKSLPYPTDRLTASHIAIFFADLEYRRRDYAAAAKWLRHHLVASPYNAQFLAASIRLSLGDFNAAEHALLELIRQRPETRLAYHQLFAAYLGQTRWEDAARLENEMRAKFHEKAAPITEKLQAGFSKRTRDQKADFYAEFNNYGAAIDLIEGKPARDFADFMKLTDLYYRSGKPEIAEKMIHGLLELNPRNHSLFNQFGEFYVKKLNRPEQALDCFERSIRIKPDQPKVRALIAQLSRVAVRDEAAD